MAERQDIDRGLLSRTISAAAGEQLEITRVEDLDDGANKSTHIKLTEKSGRVFSLKHAGRIADGTRHEYFCWWVARLIGLSGARLVALVAVPAGVAGLSGTEAVLLEWMPDAKPINQLPPPASAGRSSEATAKQIGGWVWLALRFGISDRHLGNWVWSEAESSMAMIDLEEWSFGSFSIAQYVPIVAQVMGQPKKLHNFARHFFNGAREARDAFNAHRARIDGELTRLGLPDPAAGGGRVRRH